MGVRLDLTVVQDYKDTFFHFSQVKENAREGASPVNLGDKITFLFDRSNRDNHNGKFTAKNICNVSAAESRKRAQTDPQKRFPSPARGRRPFSCRGTLVPFRKLSMRTSGNSHISSRSSRGRTLVPFRKFRK